VTTVRAGQHGDLAQAHADMGIEGLLLHLATDHGQPVDRRLGAAIAQHTHRTMHEREQG
jgi:hypothetical protein